MGDGDVVRGQQGEVVADGCAAQLHWQRGCELPGSQERIFFEAIEDGGGDHCRGRNGQHAIRILQRGIQAHGGLVVNGGVEGVERGIKLVEAVFGAVADAVFVAIAVEGVAGDAEGVGVNGNHVAVDFHPVVETVAVAVGDVGVCAVASFLGVVEAVAVFVGEGGAGAVFDFGHIGQAVVVAVPIQIVGVLGAGNAVAVVVCLRA